MKLISLIVSVLACYAKRELLIVLPVDRRASGSVMSVIDEENDGTGLQEAKVRRRICFSDFGVNENISGEPPSRHLASAPLTSLPCTVLMSASLLLSNTTIPCSSCG